MMFFVSLAAAARLMRNHDRDADVVRNRCQTIGCAVRVELPTCAVQTLLLWVARTGDQAVWSTVWRCDAHLPDMVSGSGGRPRRGRPPAFSTDHVGGVTADNH